MTDVCVHICMEGIRNGNPELDEKAVIEKVREREPAKHKRGLNVVSLRRTNQTSHQQFQRC